MPFICMKLNVFNIIRDKEIYTIKLEDAWMERGFLAKCNGYCFKLIDYIVNFLFLKIIHMINITLFEIKK